MESRADLNIEKTRIHWNNKMYYYASAHFREINLKSLSEYSTSPVLALTGIKML